MNNPLFPQNPQDSADNNSFVMGPRAATPQPTANGNPAADLIRQRIETLYNSEPGLKQEIGELADSRLPLSAHQKFIQQLIRSGKPMADIQTAWHNYYINLPDDQKHEVWHEFYEAARETPYNQFAAQTPRQATGVSAAMTPIVVEHHGLPTQGPGDSRLVSAIKSELINKISAGGKLKTKHHLKSLAFGLSMGFLVILILLFSFFNQVIIAPFIQPSRHESSTPLIVDSTAGVAINSTEVIIPKINVEIPVDYSQTSSAESTIESALNNGVVHYPTTVLPGQNGNAAFFGHSSNKIFNSGKYKFAFVLLHTLTPGDTFYLGYQGKMYIYQVFKVQIVAPNDVNVLTASYGKTATATLITCDPPGTSINRLVVTGEQISPSPTSNSTPVTQTAITGPSQITSDGPSLWSRLWHSLF